MTLWNKKKIAKKSMFLKIIVFAAEITRNIRDLPEKVCF